MWTPSTMIGGLLAFFVSVSSVSAEEEAKANGRLKPGQPAEAFQRTDILGTPISLGDSKGKN